MTVKRADLVVQPDERIARQIVASAQGDVVFRRVNQESASWRQARSGSGRAMGAVKRPVNALPIRGDKKALGEVPATPRQSADDLIIRVHPSGGPTVARGLVEIPPNI